MNYAYMNMFYTVEMIEENKLAEMLESGWEMVMMVPFRMRPEDGGTIIAEYLVTLRQPEDSAT
jgi:hypothetical protein